MKPPRWHDKRGPSACRSSHAIGLLLVGAVPPPITWQSHPLPSSHGRDQGGLQRHPGGDTAGWETSPPPPGCGFGSALPTLLCGQEDTERTLGDVGVPTCGTNTQCRGWWRVQSGRELLASRAGSPSLKHAFLRAQGALGWLWLPESSRAVVEPASSPSIILISQRWQPGGPRQRG